MYQVSISTLHELFNLTDYGSVFPTIAKILVHKKDNTHYAIISPRYQKLEAIRRIMDYNEMYFNFEYIACTRYDGLDIMDNVKVNHNDIIIEAQKTNRHFSYKWISDRSPKTWN